MDLSKLLIIGDPHLVRKSLDKSSKLFDLIDNYNMPILLLGDQLDTKSVIDGYALNFLYKRLSESKNQWILLVGNHDLFDLDDNSHHSMEVFKALPNVTIIDKVIEIDGYYFMPYIHSQKILNEELSKISKGSTILGHFEISGLDFGNGRICDSGMVEHSFKKFKRVISGHFHKPQQKGNITYIGTAFSNDFGETDQDKFIACLDRQKDTLELIPTDFPKHKTIQVDAANPVVLTYNPQDIVRVVLKGTSEQIAAVPRMDGIRYDEKPIEDEIVLVEESEDHLTQFQSWGVLAKLNQDVIELGVKLLKEAKR